MCIRIKCVVLIDLLICIIWIAHHIRLVWIHSIVILLIWKCRFKLFLIILLKSILQTCSTLLQIKSRWKLYWTLFPTIVKIGVILTTISFQFGFSIHLFLKPVVLVISYLFVLFFYFFFQYFIFYFIMFYLLLLFNDLLFLLLSNPLKLMFLFLHLLLNQTRILKTSILSDLQLLEQLINGIIRLLYLIWAFLTEPIQLPIKPINLLFNIINNLDHLMTILLHL